MADQKNVQGEDAQSKAEIVKQKEAGPPQPGDTNPEDVQAHPEAPSDSELKKADSNLPVYDQEKAAGEALPDTPSGYALKQVGNLDGEDVEPEHLHAANVHGEAYQAAKRKMRWG